MFFGYNFIVHHKCIIFVKLNWIFLDTNKFVFHYYYTNSIEESLELLSEEIVNSHATDNDSEDTIISACELTDNHEIVYKLNQILKKYNFSEIIDIYKYMKIKTEKELYLTVSRLLGISKLNYSDNIQFGYALYQVLNKNI